MLFPVIGRPSVEVKVKGKGLVLAMLCAVYVSHSHSCIPRSQKCSQNVGGGTAFLIKTPFVQLPSTIPAYTSFEASVITLKLRSSQLSVFNVYRPPASSSYAKPFATFLEEFHSFLCSAATTPHVFLITGDFNIHI